MALSFPQVLALDEVWVLSNGLVWRLAGQALSAVALPAGAVPTAIFGRGSAVYLAGPGHLLEWNGKAFSAVASSAASDALGGAVAVDGTVTLVGLKGAIAQGRGGSVWTRLPVATAASFSTAVPLADGSVLLGVDPQPCAAATDDACPAAPKPVGGGGTAGCTAAPGSLELMLGLLGLWLFLRRFKVTR